MTVRIRARATGSSSTSTLTFRDATASGRVSRRVWGSPTSTPRPFCRARPAACTATTSSITPASTQRSAPKRTSTLWRPPCASAAWASFWTSSPTTCASPARPTTGGTTCSKTAAARPTRRSSTSTGTRPRSELHEKVLLPVLGEQYGRVLESQRDLASTTRPAPSQAHYGESRFPSGRARSCRCSNRSWPTCGAPTPTITPTCSRWRASSPPPRTSRRGGRPSPSDRASGSARRRS